MFDIIPLANDYAKELFHANFAHQSG